MHDDIFDDDGYGYFGCITSRNDWYRRGRSFSIEKISKNVETNTYTYTLGTFFLGQRVVTEFPRSHLDKKYLGELQSKGFDINTSNFDIAMKVLQNLEEDYYANMKNFHLNHIHVGWQDIEINGSQQLLFKSYNQIGDYASDYLGTLNIEPKGTHQEQLELIKNEVVGHTPLEIALAIGASAIVNGFIGEAVQTNTLLFHCCGDSTQGKTTAAQLAVSVCGSCDLQTSSLFMSWLGTVNSIIARMRGNHGMCVAFDELSKFKGNDMSNIVYTLSDGREKDRCDKDGTLKGITEFDSWQTTIISTGETSLLGRCNENVGLRVRVIEINDVFTTSAEHADRIKAGVKKNYGTLAPLLAMSMTQIGHDRIVKKHQKLKAKFAKRCGNLKMIDRIAGNIAIVLVAAALLNKVFNLNLNLNNMVSYFEKLVKENNDSRDMGDKALSKLLGFVGTHQKNFALKHKGVRKRFQTSRACTSRNASDEVKETIEIPAQASECWGKIIDGECLNLPDVEKQLVFYADKFNSIIRQLGFEEPKVVLSKLKEKGYLDSETGKNYRKRRICETDSKNTHVIVINVPETDETVTDDEATDIGTPIIDDGEENDGK